MTNREHNLIQGINHLTLAVSDLNRSLHFYLDVLGMQGHVRWDTGAYLSFGDVWLCLSLSKVAMAPAQNYSHLALDIAADHFPSFVARLRQAGAVEWQQNQSEGDSCYFLDPDGHQLEIHCGSLQSRLAALKIKPYAGLVWL
jgi:catechol 2,3-dioxygenase-like lactoylglutathione lyase family enzyme